MTMMINLMRTKRKKKSIGRDLTPSKWLKKEMLAVQSGGNYNPYYLIWAAGEVSELSEKIKHDYAHLCSGFPLVGGGGVGGHPLSKNLLLPKTPHYPKNGYLPPLFCPKNVDFTTFMQFLVISPKMSSSTSPP